MKIALTIITVFIIVWVLFSEDNAYQRIALSFVHDGNKLSGAIMVPKNRPGPFPVLAFVHGDGALPFDAYGYYRPLWNRLAQQGIASFSWDKPGIGSSQGDWESQSMDNRADETIAAIEMLKRRSDIKLDKIGLIGYSQAGWVLPLVAGKSNDVKFLVMVSGAINWMDQGAYLTRTRLMREGYSETQIKQAVEEHYTASEIYFAPSSPYERYLQAHRNNAQLHPGRGEPMTPRRFRFVKLNWLYDARDNLKDIHCPTLAIFGQHDVNVNIKESVSVYQEQFARSGNKDLYIKVFPEAQHALLKNQYFDEIVPGIGFFAKFEILGEDAFADHYLDFVVNWISEKTAD
jgi:pimeloyl-ACP methyl ester carboxylesterase